MTSNISGSPAVLLTPGRTRNIAQDMEALRLSRQDNPYLQVLFNSYISELLSCKLNNIVYVIITASDG